MRDINKQINVLVVDDSAFMRRVITDLLNSDPSIKVIGTARNGIDALKKIAEMHPDVVTLDVEMPIMDGLTTLEKIMQETPVPVIMLSSLTRAGAEITIKALQKGAVDFVAKPSGTISLDLASVKEELVSKVKVAATVEVSKALKREPVANCDLSESLTKSFVTTKKVQETNKLVLIGTSTGGPQALHTVLSKLPKKIPAAIVIVQHMPPGFTRSLAERLDQISEINVKEAEDNERVVAGTAYIAPGDYHLVLECSSTKKTELLLRLNKDAPVNGHRPSVDVMMKSAARIDCCDFIGVIMTGMGHDGREGVRALKEKQAKIIAEDEKTAVVYGMPKAVIEANLADHIVPLPLIAQEIVRLLDPQKN